MIGYFVAVSLVVLLRQQGSLEDGDTATSTSAALLTAAAYGGFTCALSVLTCITRCDMTADFARTILYIVHAILAFSIFVCILGVLQWQWYLISRRMTSIEEIALSRLWARARFLGIPRTVRAGSDMRSVHIYDLGTPQNLHLFLFGSVDSEDSERRRYGPLPFRALAKVIMVFLPVCATDARVPINEARVREHVRLLKDIETKVNAKLISGGLRERE
eukprot:g1082.t1